MARQRDLYDRHELATAEAFAAHLASLGIALTDLAKGDEPAGEPDVRGLVNGHPHGVEVVDAWYSEADARGAWGLVRELERTGERGHVAGAGFNEKDLEHPSGDPYVAVLQRALDDHGRKRYGIPTWLVLNASGTLAPLHHTGDGPRLAQALCTPTRFTYLDAFLFLSPNGGGRPAFFRVPSPYREGCGICGWIDDEDRPPRDARAAYDGHVLERHPHLLSRRRPAAVVDPGFELPRLPVRRLPRDEERARLEVASRAHADATPPASTPPLAEQIATADEWRHWPRLREALGPITHLRELLYGERPADTEAERLKEFVRLAVYDLLVTGREDAPDFIVQARIREATSQRDALFDEIEKQLDEREPFMRGVARSSAFATGYRTFVDASSPASLAQLELEASGNAILEALPAHLRSVAVRIAVGREPKDIATELGKSVKSIRRYEEELRARLGAKSRAELVSRISSA